MRLRTLMVAVVLLALGGIAEAQQSGKVFRIGLLDLSDARTSAVRLKAFWEELRKLGWIEGKNIIVESRFAEGKRERRSDLAAELVRLKVDVIVCPSTDAALAAKRASNTIPIVAYAAAPVRLGLVASLARPGGNVTGVSGLSVDLNTKRLEVLKDAVPKLDRVGLPLTSSRSVSPELQMKELRLAADALKLKLEEIKTSLAPKALETAFQVANQRQVGAILIIGRPLFSERKRIVDLAAKYRLPAIYPQKEYVDEGGLMFYGIDQAELFRRGAHHVDKILRGTKPADIPVEQGMRTEFIINLKAAQEIGHTIPPEVLARATRVIK